MKKMYLVKSMAALAMGLVAVSCNKASFDEGAYQNAKEQESQEQFVNNVMGGQQIDPNQNWKTTNTIELTVTTAKEGTLKIYPANPIGNTTGSLYTINVTAGQTVTFNVTKGVDLTKLYAAVVDENNFILDMLTVDATAEKAEVNMTSSETRGAARRVAAAPTEPDYASETNPIAGLGTRQKTVSVNDMPTASTAAAVVTKDVTTSYNYNYQSTVYIAPGVTFTLGNDYEGFAQGAKVYMGKGSRIVASNKTLSLGSNTVIYNDGGTIEAKDLSLDGCTVWNKGTITLTNGMWFSANNPAYVYNSGTISAYNGLSLNKNGILWNEGTLTSDNGNLNCDAADNASSAPYIYNSGTISTKNVYLNKYATLWDAGTVTVDGDLKGGNDETKIYVASGHRLTAKYFEFNNNNQVLWIDGTVDISGAINIYNSSATIMNHGTLKGASFDGKAGAKFYNAENCLVEITGETHVKNSNSAWVNDGTYKSGTFIVSGGGNQVFNNCRLTCTGKFTMGQSDGSRFVLDGQASVICDSFDFTDRSFFWMGGGSIVKVANTLKSNNANWESGFLNPTSDFAVITAKAITTDNVDSQWRAWYQGKIYVDTDSHFEFKSFNQTQKNYYLGDGAVMTGKQGTAPLDWDESPCRPEYHGGGGRIESTIYYYYAFEDLGAIGDFDFNDVVLRLSAPESNQSTVQVMAAGGTLPVQVTYGGTNLGGEVHGEFDVQTGVMINTGQGPNLDPIELGVVNIAANADMANLPFGIVVSGAGSIKVTNEVDHTGEAPLMIVVSGYPSGDDAGKWFWPREYMNISKAYTKFGAWGADVQSNTDWYHHYTEGNVWKY